MNHESDFDFNQIILGCRKNKRTSQNALYRLYYSYGMSIAIRYVNSESEAISIVNDGFFKVFSNMKKFDPKQSFKPWFRRIIINTSINYIREQKKFKNEVDMDLFNNLSAKEEILSKINYKELIEMVQSLSTAYRTVFNMYVIDGYKHNEIAETLGITVSTSKSNLARARANLRNLVTSKMDNLYE